MRFTIISCSPDPSAANSCSPNGSGRYISITGNGAAGDARDHIDGYIGQLPALSEGVNYKLTAYVKGNVGDEVRFTYPSHTSVLWKGTVRREWQKVQTKFVGRDVGTLLLQVDGVGRDAFGVDGVRVDAV
jgi:hypothetical protein